MSKVRRSGAGLRQKGAGSRTGWTGSFVAPARQLHEKYFIGEETEAQRTKFTQGESKAEIQLSGPVQASG